MNTVLLVEAIQTTKCRVRLKLKRYLEPDSWRGGAIMPVPGCIEVNGPWPIREVEWLEIDPVVLERVGRLVPPRRVDSTAQLASSLREGDLPYTLHDSIFRIPFIDAV